MSLLSLILPTLGSPDATEDVKINNAFTAVQTWANGNVDGTNLSAAAAQSAGVNQSGQVVKGSSVIATSQSTGSTTYTTLATPDQVSNVVLPAAGLIAIWYQATWQESVSGAARAAIFLGSNQLSIATFNGASGDVEAARTDGSAPGNNIPLFSFWGGLASMNSAGGYAGDVTTGQVIGGAQDNMYGDVASGLMSLGSGAVGGPCHVFAAAGTYTVSVRFMAGSGSMTAANRRLYVQAISFA